jgi:hypothetical protein
VGHRSGQLDVADTLSADTGLGYFYAASVTDYAFITDLFIFAAMTFPVLAGSENTLTEQTVPLGL